MRHKLKDPVLDEVHRVKDALSAQHGHDLHRLFATLKASEERGNAKLVTLSPRKLPATKSTHATGRSSSKSRRKPAAVTKRSTTKRITKTRSAD